MNVKTFNTIVNYKTDLPEGVTGYNLDLIRALKNSTEYWEKTLGIKMIPLKADYLAERSIPDNIEEEGS